MAHYDKVSEQLLHDWAEEEKKHYTYDVISKPKHYNSDPSGVEPITITQHMSFCLGNVIKYVMRSKYKGSELEDLKKAYQYLEWEIQRLEVLNDKRG